MRSNNDTIRFRMKWMAALVLLPAITVLVRLYFVQVRQHDEFLEKARARYTTTRITSGRRGEIYDVSGNLLVSNVPCVHVTADPSNLGSDIQRRRLAALLAYQLGGDDGEYYRRLRPTRFRYNRKGEPLLGEDGKPVEVPNRYTVIARDLDIDVADAIKKQLQVTRINGVLFFTDSYKRTYPKGSMLSNVLGYTNVVDDSDVAQLGLEKYYDRQMTANAGREIYERDRIGRPLNYGLHESLESRDGRNIYLTISEPIQAILEEELDKAWAEWKPAALYAAIVDPKTGSVLAMAQRPTFDPNDRSTFSPAASRTRIAEDGLEPGSIIKPFSIGKALDWGVVTPDTEIDCEHGRWIYLGRPLTDTHPYDRLTVAGVIQKSSNIGTAKIAMMLGPERAYQALRSFGFGTRTGLPFPGETAGRLPSLESWRKDGLAITRIPIGYGVRVSPLQMLRAYCALANHGLLPQLRLVDRIQDPVTGVVTKLPVPDPVQMFDNPATCDTLVRMMVKVTEPGGTAVKAAIPGYQVAGKTGTARKYIPGHGYASGKYFSSFVGFVPARDPALVMLVTMDEPKGAYYASTVAAPTFKATCTRVLRHLNIQPDPVPETGSSTGQKP